MDIRENEKIIDVTIRGESIRGRFRNAYSKAKEFGKDHKKEVFAALVIILPMIRDVEKTLRSRQITKREQEKDRTYYDPSTGLHWELKRKMRNYEREELCQRKRNGEYTEDILYDMKILR